MTRRDYFLFTTSLTNKKEKSTPNEGGPHFPCLNPQDPVTHPPIDFDTPIPLPIYHHNFIQPKLIPFIGIGINYISFADDK